MTRMRVLIGALLTVFALLTYVEPIDAQETGWTPWLNRDNPGGSGDFETLRDFLNEGKACPVPVAIECRTTSGVDWQSAGQVYDCTTSSGGVCRNDRQPPGRRCLDYEVRFKCCQIPPSACPAGKPKIGEFTSPGGQGWGEGVFAACLEGPQTVTANWCSAAYNPRADHRCDDYRGYSTITSFGGRKYCVYDRTDSTYYKALAIGEPGMRIELSGLHYPEIHDCEAAIADYRSKFKQSGRNRQLCAERSPGSQPVEIEDLRCVPGTRENRFNTGTVLAVVIRCGAPVGDAGRPTIDRLSGDWRPAVGPSLERVRDLLKERGVTAAQMENEVAAVERELRRRVMVLSFRAGSIGFIRDSVQEAFDFQVAAEEADRVSLRLERDRQSTEATVVFRPDRRIHLISGGDFAWVVWERAEVAESALDPKFSAAVTPDQNRKLPSDIYRAVIQSAAGGDIDKAGKHFAEQYLVKLEQRGGLDRVLNDHLRSLPGGIHEFKQPRRRAGAAGAQWFLPVVEFDDAGEEVNTGATFEKVAGVWKIIGF